MKNMFRQLIGVVVLGMVVFFPSNAQDEFRIHGTLSEKVVIEAENHATIEIKRDTINDPSGIQLLDTTFIPDEDDLINVAFTKFSNHQLIGAVNYLDGQDIGAFNADQNVLDAIQGMVPGFYNNRLMGSGNFLIVVDGIPRSSTGQGSDFSFIENLSMQEIDQISFLKDATAAMMYGSNASNGVLLITTKRGADAGNSTNVRIESGIRTPKVYPSYLDAAGYMTMYNLARENDGELPRYTDGQIDSTRLGIDPVRYPDEGFYNSDYLNNLGKFFLLSADAYGGNEKTSYYSNIRWNHGTDLFALGQDGKNFTDNTFTFRGNVEYGINDWLSAKLDAFVLFGSDRQPVSNFWQDASQHLPNAYPIMIPVSLLDESLASSARIIDNNYVLGGTNQYTNNIYGNFMLGGFRSLISRTSQINFGLDFDLNKVTKGLTATTYLGYDILNFYTVSFDNEYAVYERSYVPAVVGSGDSLVIQKIGRDLVNQSQNLSNPAGERRIGFYSSLDYLRSFGDKHTLQANAIGYWNQSNVLNDFYSDKQNHFALRANYLFDRRFVAQMTGVVTGSGYLPDGHRYRVAPSFGLGWILSEESFLEGKTSINSLKLDASYGKIYTDAGFPSYYIYNTSFSKDGNFHYNNNLNSNSVRTYDNLGNPNIGMISQEDINLGVEAKFVNNGIWLQMNYFISTSNGNIVKRNSFYPEFIAVVPYENYEKYRDNGIDFGLRLTDKLGDFSYQFGINVTYISPKAIAVEEPSYTLTPWRRLEGQPYDAIFGYVSEGLFLDSSDVASHASQAALGNVGPGDIKYKDLNEDNEINEEDQQIIGNSKPRIQYGININLSYKNFKFFALATGQGGGDIIFSNSYYWQTGQTTKYSEVVLDSWTPETAETASYPALHLNSADNNHRVSDYWIEKNNWLSLHTLQLSYDMSDSRVAMGKGLKIYLRGNDLLTVSPIKEKLELNIGSAPQMRSYSIGFEMQF
jgi:TonB-linked SusC/RagA family outer membrane protein